MDTSLTATPEPGHFEATFSRDWEIWGPMGGYVAAHALRAAAGVTAFARPASFAAQYLGVASFDEPVQVIATSRRRARTAEAISVAITQGGRPIMDALVWAVGDGLAGLDHHVVDPPDVDGPDGLLTVQERFATLEDPPPATFAFWQNLEGKPLDWHGDWPPPGPLPAVWREWLRFQPTAVFDDPWVDACRAIVLVDVVSWPAAHRHHAWKEPAMIAPSLDLYVAFHHDTRGSEWLLADGFSPVAGDGLVGWTGRLWSEDRRLLASGAGQLLCRPVPPTQNPVL